MEIKEHEGARRHEYLKQLKPLWSAFTKPFLWLDRKLDGALVFFFKHFGKTRFMVAMSKKVQVLGIENLFIKGPKAFVYFFLFYLIRDTILYVIIPIYLAKSTVGD